ncbi:hypothetical protein ACMFMG_011408 [Clarireedia jacksonii]
MNAFSPASAHRASGQLIMEKSQKSQKSKGSRGPIDVVHPSLLPDLVPRTIFSQEWLEWDWCSFRVDRKPGLSLNQLHLLCLGLACLALSANQLRVLDEPRNVESFFRKKGNAKGNAKGKGTWEMGNGEKKQTTVVHSK